MADEILLDDQGRDIRIHGLVFDPSNPLRTTRELLRQWAQLEDLRKRNESEVLPADLDLRIAGLLDRTLQVLKIIGPNGEPL
jgi:hypothetical protein